MKHQRPMEIFIHRYFILMDLDIFTLDNQRKSSHLVCALAACARCAGEHV